MQTDKHKTIGWSYGRAFNLEPEEILNFDIDIPNNFTAKKSILELFPETITGDLSGLKIKLYRENTRFQSSSYTFNNVLVFTNTYGVSYGKVEDLEYNLLGCYRIKIYLENTNTEQNETIKGILQIHTAE